MLWLFTKAVFAHWIATMGILLTLTPFVPNSVQKWMEARMKKEFSLKHLWIAGTLLLLFAFYQAWVDEHRNAEQLITEKSQIVGEREFWKSQSYAKDEAIRTRDGLLAQNFTTLSGTQSSLAQLSNKVLDVTKPEPMTITPFPFGVTKNTSNNVTAYMQQFLLLVNRTVTPVHLLATCDKAIASGGGGILGTKATMGGDTWSGPRSDRSYGIGVVSPAWSPTGPLLVTLYFNDANERKCSFTEY
jgi:hypothetical protein